MAGEAARAIHVVDMSTVRADNARHTAKMMTTSARAISVVEDISRKVAPRTRTASELLFQVMTQRRSGSGPTSAPALPPTSTLTR